MSLLASWSRGAARALAGLLVLGLTGSLAGDPSRPRGISCPGTDVELEPNDTPATATLLQLGSGGQSRGIGGGITAPGDVDYYRLAATAGDRLWASVDTGRSSGMPPYSRDSVLAVYAADGTTLLEQDDDDGTANGLDATVESQEASLVAGLLLPSTGTYVLRVAAKSPAALMAPYTLLIGLSNGSSPEQEPNDDPGSVPFLGNWVHDGSLSGPGDVDYYHANLLGGLPFVAVDGDPERDGTGTDVRLDLVDTIPPHAMQVWADSSGAVGSPAPPAEGLLDQSNSQRLVKVTGPAAGTYRIGITWSGYCPVPVVLEKMDVE